MGDTDFGDILNDDWAQDHFKIKQLPVTSQDNSHQSQIFERSSSDFQLDSYLEYMVFMIHSNLRTLFDCRTKSINFSRISPSSIMMWTLLMFLTLDSLVTGSPRRNSKYAKDWVQLDKDHWRGHIAKTVKRTR